MNPIKISVCITTRNRARFIGEAIESVISQAGEEVEIVIVDGASTDNTREVVVGYQQKFKNLVYHREEQNHGVDRDMAKTLELARGEYCWLFSDDDAFKPGVIARMLKEIESGCEIYLCNITTCDHQMKPLRERYWLSRTVKDRIFDLHDKTDFLEYCHQANSIAAFFSYWSSIIVKRDSWFSGGVQWLGLCHGGDFAGPFRQAMPPEIYPRFSCFMAERQCQFSTCRRFGQKIFA